MCLKKKKVLVHWFHKVSDRNWKMQKGACPRKVKLYESDALMLQYFCDSVLPIPPPGQSVALINLALIRHTEAKDDFEKKRKP